MYTVFSHVLISPQEENMYLRAKCIYKRYAPNDEKIRYAIRMRTRMEC